MSSWLRLGSLGVVALFTSLMGFGCGGGDDPDPPQILAHQNPVNFQNFGTVDTCNSDGICGARETCNSCEADCNSCDDCDVGDCRGVESFQVILMNDGDGTLDVTDFEVRGDAHCALTPPPALDQELPVHLSNADEIFLNLDYIPGGDLSTTAGTRDAISIAFTSNSATFPLFEILVCGCVVDDVETAPPCQCLFEDVGDVNCGG
jgi:hypothetical protein